MIRLSMIIVLVIIFAACQNNQAIPQAKTNKCKNMTFAVCTKTADELHDKRDIQGSHEIYLEALNKASNEKEKNICESYDDIL